MAENGLGSVGVLGLLPGARLALERLHGLFDLRQAGDVHTFEEFFVMRKVLGTQLIF